MCEELPLAALSWQAVLQKTLTAETILHTQLQLLLASITTKVLSEK
jgi:hypothetical protein